MTKFFTYPLRVLDAIIDRVVAAAGALLFAQFPQFYAQYLQRLAGHVDEARRSVELYREAAAGLNLTLEEYIELHLSSGNEVFVSSGKIIAGFVERLQQLENAFHALKNAIPWKKIIVFLQQMNKEIATATWGDFTPGVPTTSEGIAYAIIGLLVALGLYQGLKAIILGLYRLVFPGAVTTRPGGQGPSLPA